jgi:UDP-glucuronate 4-epimerase
VNLGRGEPVLLADFVHLIEELTGRTANLTAAPMLDADIGYTYASIENARHLLDYEPQTSAPDGVRQFWSWYRRAVLGEHQVIDFTRPQADSTASL